MSKPLGFGLLEFKTFTTQMVLKSTIKTNNNNKKKLQQSLGALERSAIQNEDLRGLSQSISCEPHGSHAHFTHEETEAEESYNRP